MPWRYTSFLGIPHNITCQYMRGLTTLWYGITVAWQSWMNRTMGDDVEHSVAYDVDRGTVKEPSWWIRWSHLDDWMDTVILTGHIVAKQSLSWMVNSQWTMKWQMKKWSSEIASSIIWVRLVGLWRNETARIWSCRLHHRNWPFNSYKRTFLLRDSKLKEWSAAWNDGGL